MTEGKATSKLFRELADPSLFLYKKIRLRNVKIKTNY